MEKIGLINKIARNIDSGWEAYKKLENSQLMQKRNDTLAETLTLLKEIKASKT